MKLESSYHALSVAILSAHREVESEEIAVDDVDVASLGSAKSVNTTVERLIRSHLNGDSGVFAVYRNFRNKSEP